MLSSLPHSKLPQGHSDSPDDHQDRIDPDNHNSIPRKNILRKHGNCHGVEFGAMVWAGGILGISFEVIPCSKYNI